MIKTELLLLLWSLSSLSTLTSSSSLSAIVIMSCPDIILTTLGCCCHVVSCCHCLPPEIVGRRSERTRAGRARRKTGVILNIQKRENTKDYSFQSSCCGARKNAEYVDFFVRMRKSSALTYILLMPKYKWLHGMRELFFLILSCSNLSRLTRSILLTRGLTLRIWDILLIECALGF